MKDKIKIISPRSEVEIHLPDGRVLSGPRGAAVGEFLSTLEYDSQLVAAIVNGDLRELTYAIQIESRVEPVTMSSPDGGAHLSTLTHISAGDGIRRSIPWCYIVRGSLGCIGRILLPGNRTRASNRF